MGINYIVGFIFLALVGFAIYIMRLTGKSDDPAQPSGANEDNTNKDILTLANSGRHEEHLPGTTNPATASKGHQPNVPLGSISTENAWDKLVEALTPTENVNALQREIIAWLDSGGDVNWRGPKGMSLLHFAAMCGNTDMVRLLVKRGAQIEAKEESVGATPLSFACQKNGEKVIPILLEFGANPYSQATDGYTPFALAQRFLSAETKEVMARFASTEQGCVECGSPNPDVMKTRGVSLRINFATAEYIADYTCKSCGKLMDFPLTAVSKFNGGLLMCPDCRNIVFIPSSVWCSKCGQSFSSSWQEKIRSAQ